jgi:hypothetical protein
MLLHILSDADKRIKNEIETFVEASAAHNERKRRFLLNVWKCLEERNYIFKDAVGAEYRLSIRKNQERTDDMRQWPVRVSSDGMDILIACQKYMNRRVCGKVWLFGRDVKRLVGGREFVPSDLFKVEN